MLDGRVSSIAEVGNTIILGGTFTQTRNNDSQTVIARYRLVAFDKTTKQISTTFAPNPNGDVEVVLPAPRRQVRLRRRLLHHHRRAPRSRTSPRSTSPTARWSPRSSRRRSTAGSWTCGSRTTGSGSPGVHPRRRQGPERAGHGQPDHRQVRPLHEAGHRRPAQRRHHHGPKIDVNSQRHAADRARQLRHHRRLVKRHQLFMLDLSGATAATANWQTAFYKTACSKSFNSYMRDLDFSPTAPSSWSPRPVPTAAPARLRQTARFETGATGRRAARPGSTTPAATRRTPSRSPTRSSTPAATPAGRTTRSRRTRAGQGAVPRPGIAALDPINGLPLSWNPTRDRGVGVFDFLVDLPGPLGRLRHRPDRRRLPALADRAAARRRHDLPGRPHPVAAQRRLPRSKHHTGGIAKRSYTGSAFAAAQAVPAGST